jgi:glycosyltransferase involved in cell wall biosynthesis
MVNAFPQLPHTLLLVGKATWFAERVREAARSSGVEDRIRFTGFVSDSDLLQLYNACDLFVFPSFYEGFGLPALEAMACGRAVTCSNTSALPEVVDGAAILFDPYSVEEMVRAMADLLRDTQLRTRMERLGLQRAAHFSWQKSAAQTLDVYHDVAERAGARRRPISAAIGRS